MNLPAIITRVVTGRPRLATAVAVAIALGSIGAILGWVRFDTEILNLLPAHFDSVATFKQYNANFAQARELTFCLLDETGRADLAAFADFFAARLAAEPWVVRVMAVPPLEDPAAARELPALAVPLLLNMEPAAFAEALGRLDPGALAERWQRLRVQLGAGSPRAEFELAADPLGLVFPALRPVADSVSVERLQPFAAADGTARVLFALTRQESLHPYACQETMRRLAAVEGRAAAAWPGPGPAPRILVTGRTPYVAEMSAGMQGDVALTLGSSVLLVAGLFYFGFRRVRPLAAMMGVLLLSGLVALAVGGLVLGELNAITIGFGAMLIGLGIDFGMIFFGAFIALRAAGADHPAAVAGALGRVGRGVFFGAVTSAGGFLALLLSECAGFGQLGVLIAFGVLFAAAFMAVLMFCWSGPLTPRAGGDPLGAWLDRYADGVFARPGCVMRWSCAGFALVVVLALQPVGRLAFDPNPRSLEPAGSKAGLALRTLTSRLAPAAGEPVLALVGAPDQDALHAAWQRVGQRWAKLVKEKRLAGAATPAGLILSPARLRANAARLAAVDFARVRRELVAGMEANGFDPAGLTAATELVERLAAVAADGAGGVGWDRVLPAASPWWFILDRFLGMDGKTAVAYVSPPAPICSNADQARLRELLRVDGVELHLSGWTYTLADLIPWAKGKAILLSLAALAVNVAVLIFLYRRPRPLAVLLFALGLALAATVATLKLFSVPLNLFNVLAFPLVLGVGVDYGIYVLLATRQAGDRRPILRMILKPVVLSGLTSVAGFGSLGLAYNPSLSGLGIVSAIGIGWCLLATLVIIVPAAVRNDFS